jgi:quinol monooxygenase YgiN
MVIVAGHVTVEPKQRDSYLAGCVSIVEQARAAAGCLDVAIAADLIEPGRVNLFERWESQAAVEAFRSSGPSNEQLPAMLSVSVAEYDIADVRPLFGEGTALTSRTDRATTDQTAAARPSERRQDQQAGSRPRSA